MSIRIISVKLIGYEDIHGDASLASENDLIEDTYKFAHPFFMAVAGYIGEFFIVAVIYIYMGLQTPESLPKTKLSILQLILPAICDFGENLLLILGIQEIYPSLSVLSRALVLPMAVLLSKYMLRKAYNRE